MNSCHYSISSTPQQLNVVLLLNHKIPFSEHSIINTTSVGAEVNTE